MKKRLLNVLLLTTGLLMGTTALAQFGCGSAVVITNGYTATGIITPGTAGPEDWNNNPTGTSINASYWDDDVYLFEYTAGGTTENISMTIFTRNSWNGIGIFDDCTGMDFSTELDAVGSGGSSGISQTVSATIAAGNTVYIAVGQWGTPNDLDFDVTDFTVTAITCPDPTTLGASSITASSADLSWVESGTATEWNIEYGLAGFTLGTGTVINTAVASPYNLTGLSAATDYEFYVRSICGPGDSSAYAGPVVFSTPCTTVPVPHLEDFTTYIPACWEEAADGDWTTGPTSFGTGDWNHTDFLIAGGVNNAVKVNLYSNTDREWLLSPAFDLSAGGPYELVIDAGVTSYNLTGASAMGSDDSVMVFISTDMGTTWDRIHIWAESNNPGNAGQAANIDLSAYTSPNAMFAIFGSDGTVNDTEDYDFHIGDFEIRMMMSCSDPVGYTATAFDTSAVELNWTAGGTETEWLIEYGPAGFTPGTGTQMSSTMMPDTINGLSTSTAYDFYIQAVCGPGDSSAWVGPVMETTLAPPAYCTAGVGPTSAIDSNLDGVDMTGETSSITFVNICSPAPTGVIDATSQSADVLTGYSYSVDVNAGTCGGSYTNGVAVWIDWNQDYTFDPGELLGTQNALVPFSATFNFTVPVGATLGATRMRVMQHETSSTITDPCNSYSWGSVVDLTINVGYGTSCAGVAGLTADYVGTDSVVVSWTAGTELGWNFELGADGFMPGTGTEIYSSNPTSPMDSVTGLMIGTDYDVYVQADCGADSSVWVGPLDVTTLLPCPSPTGLGGMVLASDSVSLFWTPGDSLETEWQIEYGMTGFTPGTGMVVSVMGTPSDTVTGLMGATEYDFYVQGVCGVGDSSFWIGPVTFQTPASNDEACDAIIVMADGSTGVYSNFGSTSNPSEPTAVNPSHSVWFKFAHPTASGFTIETCGSTWDTQIAAYTVTDCGDYGGFSQLAYNDDDCSVQSSIEVCTTPGDTIYVVVDPFGTVQDDFNLTVTPLASEAGTGTTLTFCAGDTINLWNGVSGNENQAGMWTYPSNPTAVFNDSLLNSGSMTLTGVDAYYILSNACVADTAFVTLDAETPGATGTAVTPFNACNTHPTSLWDGLTGSVDLGGTWSDDTGTGLLFGNTFNTVGIPTGTYQFTYTINNGVCPASSTTVNVIVNDCVGLDENPELDLTVYPNPNTGNFSVRNNGLTNEFQIRLLDLNGKLIYTETKTMNGMDILNINADVEAGIYMLYVNSDEAVNTYKVVVK